MAAEDDVIHLSDMAAPPWRASSNEQVAADHAGFELCEQVMKAVVPPTASISQRTYTTRKRWGNILRSKVAFHSGGSPMLYTCWVAPDGRASVVTKVDDGEPFLEQLASQTA